ncbi:hypothetical protein KDK77_09825 [bacterium]|nr:hypothetical protein [bacterium]MCP5462916.1 hypothetical protein [bacterium]
MITPQKMLEMFPSFRGVEFADSSYAVPDYDWLITEFFSYYTEFMRKFNAFEWRTSHDCDDKARTFCVLASLAHGQKTRPAEGIAIGEVWYYSQRLGGYHAINAAFASKKKHQPELVFIEPQVPAVISLTDQEKQSIFKARF